jgi:hypothetical protein
MLHKTNNGVISQKTKKKKQNSTLKQYFVQSYLKAKKFFKGKLCVLIYKLFWATERYKKLYLNLDKGVLFEISQFCEEKRQFFFC